MRLRLSERGLAIKVTVAPTKASLQALSIALVVVLALITGTVAAAMRSTSTTGAASARVAKGVMPAEDEDGQLWVRVAPVQTVEEEDR
jgi:hypothetical protein